MRRRVYQESQKRRRACNDHLFWGVGTIYCKVGDSPPSRQIETAENITGWMAWQESMQETRVTFLDRIVQPCLQSCPGRRVLLKETD